MRFQHNKHFSTIAKSTKLSILPRSVNWYQLILGNVRANDELGRAAQLDVSSNIADTLKSCLAASQLGSYVCDYLVTTRQHYYYYYNFCYYYWICIIHL